MPRPGSSASRKVRWPAAAAATSCPWCGISSEPSGVNRADGAGSGMHAVAPAPARSNELSSGPSSSQPARRRGRAGACGAEEKSGARKGLANCREMTDCGTTRRSGAAGTATGSSGRTSSGGGSTPTARRISRVSDRAASETTVSSARSARSPESRTAVVARIVATPSSRLNCSARRVSLMVWSALTRECSSRTSSATAWNFVRTAGVTRPRWTAASTSRTARASTEMTSPRSRGGSPVPRSGTTPARLALASSSHRLLLYPARWPRGRLPPATLRAGLWMSRQEVTTRQTRNGNGPHSDCEDRSSVVAGAGFEPATSGL